MKYGDWQKGGNCRERYSKLYSQRRISLEKQDNVHRISFMVNDNDTYTARSSRVAQRDDNLNTEKCYDTFPASILNSSTGTVNSSDCDTTLLDMVRARYQSSKTLQEVKAIDSTCESTSSEGDIVETCIHGFSLRNKERSISRSRVSRISTRRDMDIPTILAYTTTITAPVTLQMPEFKMAATPEEQLPPWSVRRAVCPVCSQKWKDRSSIDIIKNSGLKRNSSADFPSVIAPARIRSSIIGEYTPRPAVAAVDEQPGVVLGGWHHGKSTWQLTRARKFRVLKPQPPLDIKIPAAASLVKINLDNRVHRFLTE